MCAAKAEELQYESYSCSGRADYNNETEEWNVFSSSAGRSKCRVMNNTALYRNGYNYTSYMKTDRPNLLHRAWSCYAPS